MTKSDYSNYDTPNSIVMDEGLSREEKMELLNKWKADEEALQRAASEGLNGGEAPNLRKVQKAIDHLQNDKSESPLSSTLETADMKPLKANVEGIFGTRSS